MRRRLSFLGLVDADVYDGDADGDGVVCHAQVLTLSLVDLPAKTWPRC